MNQPQLIFTGGTISSFRNDDGRLESAVESLDGPAHKAGFEPSSFLKPFIIDSINFDMGEHYPKLRDAAIKALDAGNTPVVCGGTDSLVWYSTLLTKDLMRQGYLQAESNQKVIFLNSMKCVNEAPELVGNILRAGKLLADQKHLSGGFSISAEHEDGNRLVAHNVLGSFDKISSELVNAQRSNAPVGYIFKDLFQRNEGYESPPPTSVSENRNYARIAPPLFRGHDSEQILAYMKLIGQSEKPFDGILIEDLPTSRPRLYTNHRHQLVETVRWLTSQGTRVVFCGPLRFDAEKSSQLPVRGKTGTSGEWEKDLEKAGAKFVTSALTKDVYLDMVLDTPSVDHQRHEPPTGYKLRPQGVLGIRYVPDSKIMSDAMDALGPKTRSLIFSALPGCVMPNSVIPALEKHKRPVEDQYWATFEHTGNEYVMPTGTWVEKSGNHYDAGKDTEQLVNTCDYPTALEAIAGKHSPAKGQHPRVNPSSTGQAVPGP